MTFFRLTKSGTDIKEKQIAAHFARKRIWTDIFDKQQFEKEKANKNLNYYGRSRM